MGQQHWLARVPYYYVVILCVVASVALLASFFGAPSSSRYVQTHCQFPKTAKSPDLVVEMQPHDAKAVIRHVLDYTDVNSNLYSLANYTVCPRQHPSNVAVCWPRLHKAVNCRRLFDEYEQSLRNHVRVYPPPKDLKPGYEQEFLLNGYTVLTSLYFQQEEYAPDAQSPIWGAAFIADMVAAAKARKPSLGIYGEAVQDVYRALDCHPVSGTHGAVFGTEVPWIEAVLFAWGERN